MHEEIEATKKIIEKQIQEGRITMFGIPFSEYQKVYYTTNENIHGYMSQMNFQNKSEALSVLASGDHVFNLVSNNILNIDTFDTNRLTEYFALGFKRAAILKFSYREYLEFMKKIISPISLEELNSLIEQLFPFMDKNMKDFWQEIIDYNYLLQKGNNTPLNLFQMLLINVKDDLSLKKNTYLLNEENYNITRTNLSHANIHFQCCNAFNLQNSFAKTYDFIFLSNISDYFSKEMGDYWKYRKLKKYEEYLNNLLNNEGIIALAYLICAYNNRLQEFKTYPIMQSNLKISDLKHEEVLIFPHIIKDKENKNVSDGMILSRKYQ